jgi:peptidoglycan/xylan/chitin deacetylase (PgdA/CDA1 family)
MNENNLTPTLAAKAAATITPQPTPKPTQIVDYTGKKLVALTFDDGPNGTTTPLVLDKLEKYGVVASFFLIGQNIDIYMKRIMERQISLGCELDNHSWSHSSMSKMTAKEIKKEIGDTDDKIFEMAGVKPKFFRPPYIDTSSNMYDNIDLPFICGIGCNDWDASVTTQQRVDTILGSIQDGEIILLHDSANNMNTVNALDQIIPALLDKGYAFVTVSKLFELKGIDPNVEYHIWSNVNEEISK